MVNAESQVYRARLARIMDAINLKVPDRIPVVK